MNRRQFVRTCSLGALAARSAVFAQSNTAGVPSDEAMRAAIAIAQSDPERPIYHFHPPANWNNDPNGTIYYQGWHHLFYQFNPAAPRGGNQHWGHARSRDLVNWEHLPIAIRPSTDKGERAIFSGGAVLDARGRPRLFYTSIGHPSPEQWMAMPEDDELMSWRKYPGNPVLTMQAHGSVQVAQWRDPFLFKEAGRTYMVCGGNLNNGEGGEGSVQLYRAENDELTSWRFLGVVFRYGDRQIYNVECPNLFRMGDKWVLIMSPQQPCEYFIGSLDLKACRYIPETHGILDAGTAYASNISVDAAGRTILWLWGRTNTSVDKGWNGVMVLPRILSITQQGFLSQQPAPEFSVLRGPVIQVASTDLVPGRSVVLDGVRGDALEIEAELAMGNASEIGLDLRCAADGKPGLSVRVSRTGVLRVGDARTPVRRALEHVRLRVFLDRRAVEVYVNDGEAALFTTVDAGARDLGLAVTAAEPAPGRGGGGPPAPGGAAQPRPAPQLTSLRAWPMAPAAFNLERFHV